MAAPRWPGQRVIRPARALPDVNFMSGAPYAARWVLNIGTGQIYLNATQGKRVLAHIQEAIHVPLTGAWDDATAAKLVSLAQDLNTSNPGQGFGQMADTLNQSRNAQTVSRAALQFAIWYAYNGANTRLGFDSIAIPSGATLYTWGQAPADDAGAPTDVFSWDPAHDPGPDGSLPSSSSSTPDTSTSPNSSTTDNTSSSGPGTDPSSMPPADMTITPEEANAWTPPSASTSGGSPSGSPASSGTSSMSMAPYTGGGSSMSTPQTTMAYGSPDAPQTMTPVMNSSRDGSSSGARAAAPGTQNSTPTWALAVGGVAVVAAVGLAIAAHAHAKSKEQEHGPDADPYAPGGSRRPPADPYSPATRQPLADLDPYGLRTRRRPPADPYGRRAPSPPPPVPQPRRTRTPRAATETQRVTEWTRVAPTTRRS